MQLDCNNRDKNFVGAQSCDGECRHGDERHPPQLARHQCSFTSPRRLVRPAQLTFSDGYLVLGVSRRGQPKGSEFGSLSDAAVRSATRTG